MSGYDVTYSTYMLLVLTMCGSLYFHYFLQPVDGEVPIKRSGPLTVVTIDDTPKRRPFTFCEEATTAGPSGTPPATTAGICY